MFMKKDETTREKAARFARIWSQSRAKGKKTQEFMAKGLGVSKKTVQNWEKGVTSPDLFSGSEWFRLLGLNPTPYYLSFLFPELFDNIHPSDEDEKLEQALILLIKNSTAAEKRELLYLMAGSHGSSWYSLLQMFTAHCHTNMRSRVNAARMILENYEMDQKAGTIVCPDNIRPDIELLKRAVDEGKKAVLNNKSGYTSIIVDDMAAYGAK